jgi:hypothetical protein
LVFLGGGLGRAVLVGVAGTPGALAVRRSFIRQYWPAHTDKLWEVGPFAGRAFWDGLRIRALPCGVAVAVRTPGEGTSFVETSAVGECPRR